MGPAQLSTINVICKFNLNPYLNVFLLLLNYVLKSELTHYVSGWVFPSLTCFLAWIVSCSLKGCCMRRCRGSGRSLPSKMVEENDGWFAHHALERVLLVVTGHNLMCVGISQFLISTVYTLGQFTHICRSKICNAFYWLIKESTVLNMFN